MINTLEYKILKYLNDNDTGDLIDVSNLESNISNLKQRLKELKNEKLISYRTGYNMTLGDGSSINEKKLEAKIVFKGKEYLNMLEKDNKSVVIENYIGGDNYGNQSRNNFSNNPIINNTTAKPSSEFKQKSIILKFWKLISENKLISGFLLVVIFWVIKKYFNIDFK